MEMLTAPLPRRITKAVKVGSVIVGGGAPIVVQSMTNTDTADVDSTVAQVAALHKAGSELVPYYRGSGRSRQGGAKDQGAPFAPWYRCADRG